MGATDPAPKSPHWTQPRTWPTPLLFAALAAVAVTGAWLTVDLLSLAMANLDFLRRHGAMAVAHGGLVQLALIGLKGFAALFAYLAFRGIEGELLRRWTGQT